MNGHPATCVSLHGGRIDERPLSDVCVTALGCLHVVDTALVLLREEDRARMVSDGRQYFILLILLLSHTTQGSERHAHTTQARVHGFADAPATG